jgi:hypothetical protein
MHSRRGFTLVEAGFSVAAVSMLLCVFAVEALSQPEPPKNGVTQPETKPRHRPKRYKEDKKEQVTGANGAPLVTPSLVALGKARASARQIKDSTQIRGIHQGMVMWAQNNNDSYPLPSVLDKANTTVKGPAAEKDTTANIISVMIYNGFFGPELCVSPAETNDKIKQMPEYSYSEPKAAVDPVKSLWDPGFRADFTSATGGNFSYAHLMPSHSRRALWSNTFSAVEPAIGNRAPKVEGVREEKGVLVPVLPRESNTYAIHGSRTTWEGNMAFNDNHVQFITEMSGPLKYTTAEKTKKVDNYFYNEADDPADSNAVLGIYTHAGDATVSFKGIWD